MIKNSTDFIDSGQIECCCPITAATAIRCICCIKICDKFIYTKSNPSYKKILIENCTVKQKKPLLIPFRTDAPPAPKQSLQ